MQAASRRVRTGSAVFREACYPGPPMEAPPHRLPRAWCSASFPTFLSQSPAARSQVWKYALDTKNFHEPKPRPAHLSPAGADAMAGG